MELSRQAGTPPGKPLSSSNLRKHIDSKRALKGFAARYDADKAISVPDDPRRGIPKHGLISGGNFLQRSENRCLRVDRQRTSLKSACEVFGVDHGKGHTSTHGIITKEYINYCRRDVLATSELYSTATPRIQKASILLQPTKPTPVASSIPERVTSRRWGLTNSGREPDCPIAFYGFSQSSFFGGRTSAHIRKYPVPVVYTDFLSMYPTVNSLMGLWRFVTAREIRVWKLSGGNRKIPSGDHR